MTNPNESTHDDILAARERERAALSEEARRVSNAEADQMRPNAVPELEKAQRISDAEAALVEIAQIAQSAGDCSADVTNPLSRGGKSEDLAQAERAAVVAWLQDRSLEVRADKFAQPKWRLFLWAVFCPRTFCEAYGRFWALTEAWHAITNGDHLNTTED